MSVERLFGRLKQHRRPNKIKVRGLKKVTVHRYMSLINLMGPAKSVTGSVRIAFSERTITSDPLNGTKIEVEVPTHVSGTVNFASCAIATVLTTFDLWGANLPFIEIYGSEGSLSVPDPNTFGGPVRVLPKGKKAWEEVPVLRPFAENSRGLGVADLAGGVASGEPHRSSGALVSHVLEIMHAFGLSAESGRRIELATTCERPAPLPVDLLVYGQGQQA